jgi:hypothetical protein
LSSIPSDLKSEDGELFSLPQRLLSDFLVFASPTSPVPELYFETRDDQCLHRSLKFCLLDLSSIHLPLTSEINMAS